jgi:CRISPR/Cas system-associated protein Cas5 (RAMP superfamily)
LLLGSTLLGVLGNLLCKIYVNPEQILFCSKKGKRKKEKGKRKKEKGKRKKEKGKRKKRRKKVAKTNPLLEDIPLAFRVHTPWKSFM